VWSTRTYSIDVCSKTGGVEDGGGYTRHTGVLVRNEHSMLCLSGWDKGG